MKSITKGICILLMCLQFLTGCAGRTANPVIINQPGDFERNCSYLMSEMSEIQMNINRLLPKESKTGKNVALGVTGAFFIVPLFFMDFSDAEKIEIEAYRSRYNHLARIYNDKRCGTAVESIPDFIKKSKK
ncbi:MAG: uncharacterized protein JWM09_326 [Francisellaceae bacterium]|nr:uncharacterized protein [Francisellaceae bacterium]